METGRKTTSQKDALSFLTPEQRRHAVTWGIIALIIATQLACIVGGGGNGGDNTGAGSSTPAVPEDCFYVPPMGPNQPGGWMGPGCNK